MTTAKSCWAKACLCWTSHWLSRWVGAGRSINRLFKLNCWLPCQCYFLKLCDAVCDLLTCAAGRHHGRFCPIIRRFSIMNRLWLWFDPWYLCAKLDRIICSIGLLSRSLFVFISWCVPVDLLIRANSLKFYLNCHHRTGHQVQSVQSLYSGLWLLPLPLKFKIGLTVIVSELFRSI